MAVFKKKLDTLKLFLSLQLLLFADSLWFFLNIQQLMIHVVTYSDSYAMHL